MTSGATLPSLLALNTSSPNKRPYKNVLFFHVGLKNNHVCSVWRFFFQVFFFSLKGLTFVVWRHHNVVFRGGSTGSSFLKKGYSNRGQKPWKSMAAVVDREELRRKRVLVLSHWLTPFNVHYIRGIVFTTNLSINSLTRFLLVKSQYVSSGSIKYMYYA